RRYLPLLQALTGNSPYWDATDTGYDSFRRELWVQWPMAGPPVHFDSIKDHDAAVERLVDVGAIPDPSHVYWDIRLPDKVPTIEFRAADAMTEVWETLGYAGLVRAMVMAAIDEIHDGRYADATDPAVLRYAMWHAARYGIGDTIVDPKSGRQKPTNELVEELKQWVSGPLESTGDRVPVHHFIDRIMRLGNGATRQRRATQSEDRFPNQKSLEKVVQDVIRRTTDYASVSSVSLFKA
ncbi:MAG: glutamate-cysteine ligase family protein, partial [Planctomycetota bacterium]